MSGASCGLSILKFLVPQKFTSSYHLVGNQLDRGLELTSNSKFAAKRKQRKKAEINITDKRDVLRDKDKICFNVDNFAYFFLKGLMRENLRH